MDSAAYLRRHGWQGSGFSLHPDKSQALKRPLLVSRKVDVLGLGLNKNDSVSDQWWLRAFDSSLKALGTGEKGTLGQVRDHGVKRGGLYGRFVKGEPIPSTIKDVSLPLVEQPTESPDSSSSSDSTGSDSDSDSDSDSSSDSDALTPSTSASNSEGSVKVVTKRKLANRSDDEPSKRQKTNGVPQVGADGDLELLPGEKGYKAQKYEREKARRTTKRMAREAAARTGANAINLNETPEQRIQRIKVERGLIQQAKKAKSASRAQKKQAKLDAREERKAAKAKPRSETQEKHARIKAIMEEEDQAKEEQRRKEMAEKGITHDLQENGDLVPLEAARKYPSAAQKRETKLRAQAIERGVDVEVVKAEREREHELSQILEVEYTTKHGAEKLGLDLDTYQSLPTRDWRWQKEALYRFKDLDTDKRARYEERAKAKNQHPLVYYIKREVKNENAREAGTPLIPQVSGDDLAFVVDTTGSTEPRASAPDFSLIKDNADMLIPPQEVMSRISPKLWEGVVVKELPKEVRALHKVWMRARRRIRNEERVEQGLEPKASKIGNDGKTKDQRKVERQEKLALDILQYSRRVRFDRSDLRKGLTDSAKVADPEAEHPDTTAARRRATEAGAEFVPLDEKALEQKHPHHLHPNGSHEQALRGPNNEPYPVINVQSKNGAFDKLETKLARRAARTMIRHEKQVKKRGGRAAPVLRKKNRGGRNEKR